MRRRLKFVLPLVVVAAIVVFLTSRGDEEEVIDALRPAVVRIEAEESVCWQAILAAGDETLGDPQQEQGCGDREYPLSGYAGRSVGVTKTGGDGELTVVVTIDGDETQRRSTTDAERSVLLTP